MAYLMTQASSTPNPCSSKKLEQIIEDLGRLSTTIQNLSREPIPSYPACRSGSSSLPFTIACSISSKHARVWASSANTMNAVVEGLFPEWNSYPLSARLALRCTCSTSTSVVRA